MLRAICLALAVALSLHGTGLARQAAAGEVAAEDAGDDSRIILELARSRGGDPAALAQMIQLTRSDADPIAAEALNELAAAHAGAGDLNLAAEARRVLVERFPKEPLAGEAALWLVRLYGSGELAHARRGTTDGDRNLAQQLASTSARETPTRASPPDGATEDNSLAKYGYYLASQIAHSRPTLADDPAFIFQRSAAARRGGEPKAALGLLTTLKHRRAGDTWGDCARAEAWLVDATRSSPKPTLACPVAEGAPRLDGVLDEPVWQGGAAAMVTAATPHDAAASDAPSGGARLAPAEVRLAHDNEFLYVAIACPKIAGIEYRHDASPRTRDGADETSDRVRLRLDVDRDYATWFELIVDSRGWTRDRCWDDAAWNPEWYVAAADRDDAAGPWWIVEAAIPWSELASAPPRSGDAWACAIERLAPGAAVQSWSGAPGDAAGPAAFGLLLFE